MSELRSMSYFALVHSAEFRALLAKMSKSRPGGESAYNNGDSEKKQNEYIFKFIGFGVQKWHFLYREEL